MAQREQPRARYPVPVVYRIISVAGTEVPQLANKYAQGKLDDISGGGLALATSLQPPVDAILSFGIDGLQGLGELRGTVVRSLRHDDGTCGIAVQFMGLGQHERALLREFTEYLDSAVGKRLPWDLVRDQWFQVHAVR